MEESSEKIWKITEEDDKQLGLSEIINKWTNEAGVLLKKEECYPENEITNLHDVIRQLMSSNSLFDNLIETIKHGKENSVVNVIKQYEIGSLERRFIKIILTSSIIKALRDGPNNENKKSFPLDISYGDIGVTPSTTLNVSDDPDFKSSPEFYNKVLPNKYSSLKKMANLLNSASNRARWHGKEYQNNTTYDIMYYNLGKALVFSSTDFLHIADGALSENGINTKSAKALNVDLLKAKQRDNIIQALHMTFERASGFSSLINTYRNLDEKLKFDSALAAYNVNLSMKERDESGFKAEDFYDQGKVLEFIKKYPNQFNVNYQRYKNKLQDGMTEAIKEERETVTPKKFVNPVTGKAVIRRGRLAGSGAKIMNSKLMKSIDGYIGKSKLTILTVLPKVSMGLLKVATSPQVHNTRKLLSSLVITGAKNLSKTVENKINSIDAEITGKVNFDFFYNTLQSAMADVQKVKENTKITNESSVEDFDNFLEFITEAKHKSQKFSKAAKQNKSVAKKAEYKANNTPEEKQDEENNIDTESNEKPENSNNTESEEELNVLEVGEKTIKVCQKVFTVTKRYYFTILSELMEKQRTTMSTHMIFNLMPILLDKSLNFDNNKNESLFGFNEYINLINEVEENAKDKPKEIKDDSVNKPYKKEEEENPNTNVNTKIIENGKKIKNKYFYNALVLKSDKSGKTVYNAFIQNLSKIEPMLGKFVNLMKSFNEDNINKTLEDETRLNKPDLSKINNFLKVIIDNSKGDKLKKTISSIMEMNKYINDIEILSSNNLQNLNNNLYNMVTELEKIESNINTNKAIITTDLCKSIIAKDGKLDDFNIAVDNYKFEINKLIKNIAKQDKEDKKLRKDDHE